MNGNDLTTEVAAQIEGVTADQVKTHVWKRLAKNALGEEDAQSAFEETLNDISGEISANSGADYAVGSGVFDSAFNSTDDDYGSGVME